MPGVASASRPASFRLDRSRRRALWASTIPIRLRESDDATGALD